MNLIQSEIEEMLPTFEWDDFTSDGDVYVTTYIPEIQDEDERIRFLRLRDKYPGDYAVALMHKLPVDAKLVSYDHMTLKLIVNRA
jgi:hypothetical protein